MDLMDMTHWQIGDPFSTLGSDEFEKWALNSTKVKIAFLKEIHRRMQVVFLSPLPTWENSFIIRNHFQSPFFFPELIDGSPERNIFFFHGKKIFVIRKLSALNHFHRPVPSPLPLYRRKSAKALRSNTRYFMRASQKVSRANLCRFKTVKWGFLCFSIWGDEILGSS
jgi:hypothetical protein